MKIKLTTPSELKLDEVLVDKVLEDFEEKLKIVEKGQKDYKIIINYKVPKDTCIVIERAYRDVGWTSVHCESKAFDNGTGTVSNTELRLYS